MAAPHFPLSHLLRLPVHTLQEIGSYIYDPTPIVPFTPHATSPFPLPFPSARADLQAWSSTCRRLRDAALPLLAQSVKIDSLGHIELLLREENTERRSFMRYLHVRLPPSNPLGRSAFAFKLLALMSLVPSLLHLSIEDDLHSDHPDFGHCIFSHFSLTPSVVLPNIVALELLVRCEHCSGKLLRAFQPCPLLRQIKLRLGLANDFSYGLDAGPEASPPLPVGLRTLFLEVLQHTEDVVASKSRLLASVGRACPELEDLRIYAPIVAIDWGDLFRRVDYEEGLAVVLRVHRTFGGTLDSLQNRFPHLHTLDLDIVPSLSFGPFRPRPASSSPLEDTPDLVQAWATAFRAEGIRWSAYLSAINDYRKDYARQLRFVAPRLCRGWWLSLKETRNHPVSWDVVAPLQIARSEWRMPLGGSDVVMLPEGTRSHRGSTAKFRTA